MPQASAVPKVEFEKYTLPNGLQVILHVDRKLPIVHVNQWYHVGSKNEKPGRTGFAHLFEHMMFQGSKNVPGEYFNIAEKAGANLQEGGVNGTTDNDRTNYFATVPSGNLETLLWVESDRLATLLDVTDQKKLDNQRDVVKNERRQSLENQPYGRWIDILFDQLFPQGHPYSWPVIGSMEDLSAASLDDVKDFFRRYYTPNNLSLVIAGDFDPAAGQGARREVLRRRSSPGPPLDRPDRWVPSLDAERIVEVADRVPQERTYMIWPAPEYFAADDAALNLASRILTDGLSSRLNKALVYDKPLCTAVSSFPLGAEIAGAIVVQATARPGSSLAEVERIVTEQIALLAKTGPTQAELDRARTKQEFEFVSGLERIGGFGGKADLLNQYNMYLGDPGKFEADMGRYRTLAVGDVRAAVDRWLNTRNRLLIHFRPETSGRPAESTLDRSKQPALGEDRPFRAPTVQTATLDNGLELFVVERSDLPKVAITVATRAGAIADPAGKDGLAQMTIRAIDMGTPTRKALDIENAFGDLGATLGRERRPRVLVRQLRSAEAEPVAGARHHRRRRDERDVPRGRGRAREEAAARPAGADREERRRHRVPRPGDPGVRTRPSVRTSGPGLPADDPGHHARRSRRVPQGPLEAGQLGDRLRRGRHARGGDRARQAAFRRVDRRRGRARHDSCREAGAGGRIYLVDRQDAAQTNVQQFLPAPRRDSDDYYALLLADAVWGGGGFGTRLNLNLREDKGYSYGVFSTLQLMKEAGSWYAVGRCPDRQDQGVGRRVRQGTEGARRCQGDHRPTSSRPPGR